MIPTVILNNPVFIKSGKLCDLHPVVFIYKIFYYLSRLYTTYGNSCKLLQLVNYATCFDISAIIT